MITPMIYHTLKALKTLLEKRSRTCANTLSCEEESSS